MSALATSEGTARYAKEHAAGDGYWRDHRGLSLSALGFGSYLGEVSAQADAAYVEAFVAGLRGGVNMLDTASVYRYRRSERAVGAAIRQAGVPRDRIFVATKGGFVAPDDASGLPPEEDLRIRYVETGILEPGDVVGGSHAMTPRFLAHELERSLELLGLDAVDVYYVHNPESQLLGGLPQRVFEARLKDVFLMLEDKRREGKIGAYGLATWNALRVAPGRPGHVSIERALELAREAAGEREHGLRAIELPYNIAMPEAAAAPTQPWRGSLVTPLQAAEAANLLVMGSATLHQTRLLGRIEPALRDGLGARSDVEAAIQFSRSTRGMHVSLVGTGRPEHAVENLRARELASSPQAVAALLSGGEGAYHRG